MRCCCSKYTDVELPFISNGYLHEELGKDDSFCGPIDKHTIKYFESALSNLLAIIHRDGGHYVAKHGYDKAVNDAHLLLEKYYLPSVQDEERYDRHK